MAKILVTGGAGYIGSQMVEILLQNQHEVVILDNLSSGKKSLVLGGEIIVADLADEKSLIKCFKKHAFDAVMHFAAFIQVGESVSNPSKYYHNNLCNTLNLINTALKFNVKKIIFSSSAAVYGEPQYTPIDIQHPLNPLNPYGRSKLVVEKILGDYDKAYNLHSVSLRYFNAAGADPLGRIGECHYPETHLIPLVLQAASGRISEVKIFGTDYPTPDGTCIRDYIHIVDLCGAHLLALNSLLNGGASAVYNLGNGRGFSVLEVIKTAEKVTQKTIPVVKCPRRVGDPAVLVADSLLAQKELNWRSQFNDLTTIIGHAWQWEKNMHNKNEEVTK